MARKLELRIPPPIVALLVGAMMWGVSMVTPATPVPVGIRIAAAVTLALVGFAFSAGGVTAFRRAQTTVNPMKPETASSLVTTGVYRLTRNPMYVGLTLILVGWGIFLSSVWSLLGPLVFVLYMTRFQILPEERVLSGVFGSGYSEYRSKVRRWL